MFRIFVRNWWKPNPSWPGGREPDPCADREYLDEVETEEEARAMCREWNRENEPGHLSRKAEYEEA